MTNRSQIFLLFVFSLFIGCVQFYFLNNYRIVDKNEVGLNENAKLKNFEKKREILASNAITGVNDTVFCLEDIRKSSESKKNQTQPRDVNSHLPITNVFITGKEDGFSSEDYSVSAEVNELDEKEPIELPITSIFAKGNKDFSSCEHLTVSANSNELEKREPKVKVELPITNSFIKNGKEVSSDKEISEKEQIDHSELCEELIPSACSSSWENAAFASSSEEESSLCLSEQNESEEASSRPQISETYDSTSSEESFPEASISSWKNPACASSPSEEEPSPYLCEEHEDEESSSQTKAEEKSHSSLIEHESPGASILSWKNAIFGSSSPEEEAPPVIEEEYNPYPWPKRVEVSHIEGNTNCMPLATNYATLMILFSPEYQLNKLIPMLDTRVHRFDNNTYAMNAGLMGRYISEETCKIYGLNLYYDYRQGNIGYFNQLSVGTEVLSSRWDFRANIYFPFGKKRRILTCIYDNFIGDYYAELDKIESISYSFNAEVGALLIKSEYLLVYLAGGPYYIVSRDWNGTRGGIVRLRPQYQDYIALDLSVRHDSIFDTIWQAEIILSVPLYEFKSRKEECSGRISRRQIYQPVERFEVMPLTRSCSWKANF